MTHQIRTFQPHPVQAHTFAFSYPPTRRAEMLRYLKLLLLIALPGMLLSPAVAGDYDNREFVWAETISIKEIPGMDGLVTTIMLLPNGNQMCMCEVAPPRVKCLCEVPLQGLCLEKES